MLFCPNTSPKSPRNAPIAASASEASKMRPANCVRRWLWADVGSPDALGSGLVMPHRQVYIEGIYHAQVGDPTRHRLAEQVVDRAGHGAAVTFG